MDMFSMNGVRLDSVYSSRRESMVNMNVDRLDGVYSSRRDSMVSIYRLLNILSLI
jgi:hypothetical protein